MKEKHFMLDIEATDTDMVTGDILQIAMLELDFVGGYWHPNRVFNKFLHTDQEPATQFSKENMAALFKKCNQVPYETPAEVRAEVLSFFKQCGVRPPYVYIMGNNIGSFDLPYMVAREYLVPFHRVTLGGVDVPTGDYHYRLYEQSGSISNAMCVLGRTGRNQLIEDALRAYPEIELPPGQDHDALFDCYKQLRLENGLIRTQRREAGGYDFS